MADWSPAIANEFIRLAARERKTLTQMQIQKLVYIAHGWNLAINEAALTHDSPSAWSYGPVYRELYRALQQYGSEGVTRPIANREFTPGGFHAEPLAPAAASLSPKERNVVERVYRD